MPIYGGSSVHVCFACCPHSGLYLAPPSWCQNCTRSPMSLWVVRTTKSRSSLYLRIVSSRECRIFRRDWSTETGPSLISTMVTRCTQNEKKIFGALWYPSVSLFLFIFHRFPYSLHSSQLFQASTLPYSCTTPNWLTRHRLETHKYRTTGRHACVYVCVCLFSTAKCAGWATDSGTSPTAMWRHYS